MLVPLEKGELRLGTWPHVHLHEGDAPRLRTPRLQWLRTEQEDRGAARSVFRPAALRSGVRIIAVPAHDLIASAMLGPVQIEIGNLDMFAQKTQRKTVLSERRQGADAETGRHSHRRAFPDDAHFTHGIPQALPGTKMSEVADDWATNPTTQITWGLNYISGRYGTPCSAWAHSESVGWY